MVRMPAESSSKPTCNAWEPKGSMSDALLHYGNSTPVSVVVWFWSWTAWWIRTSGRAIGRTHCFISRLEGEKKSPLNIASLQEGLCLFPRHSVPHISAILDDTLWNICIWKLLRLWTTLYGTAVAKVLYWLELSVISLLVMFEWREYYPLHLCSFFFFFDGANGFFYHHSSTYQHHSVPRTAQWWLVRVPVPEFISCGCQHSVGSAHKCLLFLFQVAWNVSTDFEANLKPAALFFSLIIIFFIFQKEVCVDEVDCFVFLWWYISSSSDRWWSFLSS